MSIKSKPLREVRSLKLTELRTDAGEDGKVFLSGYAATYNTLSEDFGYWRERIMPGAFARAVAEGQDVRHLINHDPNLVLGRTSSGTTVLTEDSKGLAFRTELPDTSFGRDLVISVNRRDVNECSFGFIPVKTAWVEDATAADESSRVIRELRDIDLFDVSTVTYPAYPGTSTEARTKSMFPDGVPAEIRSKVPALRGAAACDCECDECLDGDCSACTNADCVDENCRCMRASNWKAKAEMRLRLAAA